MKNERVKYQPTNTIRSCYAISCLGRFSLVENANRAADNRAQSCKFQVIFHPIHGKQWPVLRNDRRRKTTADTLVHLQEIVSGSKASNYKHTWIKSNCSLCYKVVYYPTSYCQCLHLFFINWIDIYVLFSNYLEEASVMLLLFEIKCQKMSICHNNLFIY